MTPEHWQRVKEVLNAALVRDPHERAAFISKACGGDESLRHEVESLIISHGEAGSFIEEPAVAGIAEIVANNSSESLAGRSFGPYEILSKLGAGGMGDVYLAQDSRLGRKVALKLLPSQFASDADRLLRFQQEARAASALNHPNILTIHEIGQIDGHPFIATEFIDGQTLREHTAKTLIKLEEALEVAVQVASALAAAHAAGIVHRDIKPENIMIRHDGFVKVLDFGLVKLTEKPATDPEAPTLVNTDAGVVMGTARYMSPEQARGKKVDARTDIWSLGVVTYEMVTGHAPFEGGTPSDVLSLILQREPAPLGRYSPEVPTELDRIIRKALHKDREERYQTVKDFLIDLKNLRRDLQFKAELDRSASPNRSDEAVAAMSSGQGVAGTAKPPVVQTSLVDAAHPTSSAEYIVSQIKSHKRGFLAFVALALLSLAVIGALAYVLVFRRGATTERPPEIKSLAVLPLKSLDAGENYLGLGIADAVIRRINQTGKLIVRPTSAVRRYLNGDTDALTAARQLNADAVLEGSVQHAGDRLRVSVNLLRTSDGASLWADSFDMRMTDIFTIQDTVAQQVASRLQLQLDPSQRARLTKRYTSNPVAYDYYVKGIYSLDQRGWSIEDKPQMEATIALFKQAISADPQYALAHAQLAYAYAWMAIFIELDPVWVEHARQEISQAEALDPQLAETHVARHLILWSAYEGFQTEAAIHELLLAQQLNPSIGHLESGVLYWHIGLEDQGSRELQKALEIDPTNEKVKEELINSTILAARIDEALAAQQRFFNRGPDLKYYLEKNMLSDAQPLLEQALAKDPNDPVVRLRKALFLALKGNFQAAEAEIPWIVENISKGRGYHHNAYEIARVYALAGKSDEAVKWLRGTAATGMPCYPLFQRDPYLNRIRQAAEFIQFMAEMKAQNERYRREFGEGATR